jgi:hypothetical protein
MKRLVLLAMALGAAIPAYAATSVGVSIGINQPGVYGRINIGDYPSPAVVYAQPVVIRPAPIAVHQRPIYMYVSTAQQQNWGRYCGQYNACAQPVYFVQDQWVRERYQHEHKGWQDDRGSNARDGHDNRRGHKKGHRGGHGEGNNR